MNYLQLVAKREKNLSQYAKQSNECIGRKKRLPPSDKRTEFERDTHRILHSLPFRRLKHKTQVFFAPKNDHICTRMEHALHVASISSTICINLDLNVDLAEAIALAHDIGHAPFGHIGETVLNKLSKENDLRDFMHEAQSLRVIDRFREKGNTLNLTYEVRDGVVCHRGEKFDQSIQPDRKKNIKAVESSDAKQQLPATLEGCVVRVADRIAYLGRDFEDATEAQIIRQDDLPGEVSKSLGKNNSEIIGTLIDDVIINSRADSINMSNEVFAGMEAFRSFNYERIYNSKPVQSQAQRIEGMLRDLFNTFYELVRETKRGKDIRNNYRGDFYQVFFEFLRDMQYSKEETDAQIIIDFLAGMTDNFAIRAFQDLFLISPPV
ncbi:MAG: HD domain-containing protein [Dehalococcoidia bacterium]